MTSDVKHGAGTNKSNHTAPYGRDSIFVNFMIPSLSRRIAITFSDISTYHTSNCLSFNEFAIKLQVISVPAELPLAQLN